MGKNKKVKIFNDYTDAHLHAYWALTKNEIQYKVKKVTPPGKGWAIFYGNGLYISE